MTPKKADEYFMWFSTQISGEIEILDAMIRREVILDFSPESLKPLENWFIPLRKYEKKSKQEIMASYANAPSFILEEMLEKRYAPTSETVELAARIALYFGEVFVKNNTDLHWGYVKTPKTDIYFNTPVIYGFSPPNMKFQAYVNTFSWCVPVYSSSPKGEQDSNTWSKWYQHWIGEKEIFWDPEYTTQKYMQIMKERQKNKNS